jgi:NADH-quinone oxidoreductase subunit M
MLLLFRKLFFGKLDKPEVKAMQDLNWKEVSFFAPLVAIVIIMGVYPASFQNVYNPTLEKILADHQASLRSAGLIEAQPTQTAHVTQETASTATQGQSVADKASEN